jgi:hypothetical protein
MRGLQREIAARKFRRVNVGVAGAEDFGVEIAIDRFGVRDVGSSVLRLRYLSNFLQSIIEYITSVASNTVKVR